MSVFIKLQDYKSILDNAEPHLLLDVRPLVEVDICHLPFSLSILFIFYELPVNIHPRLHDHSPYSVARHSTHVFRGKKA